MPAPSLADFIGANRGEIISRCRAKVAARAAPVPTVLEIDHGVPMFLDQLSEELRQGSSQTGEIGRSAIEHGHKLLFQGFTIGQVVHDYGDICQSITDLAVEMEAPIAATDFRTLNRCLDDAIAGAVTEYAHAQAAGRDGEEAELRILVNVAIAAFEVLQHGTIGVAGATGVLLHRSLTAIRAVVNHSPGGRTITRHPTD
jgi:hypothetical protein